MTMVIFQFLSAEKWRFVNFTPFNREKSSLLKILQKLNSNIFKNKNFLLVQNKKNKNQLKQLEDAKLQTQLVHIFKQTLMKRMNCSDT